MQIIVSSESLLDDGRKGHCAGQAARRGEGVAGWPEVSQSDCGLPSRCDAGQRDDEVRDFATIIFPSSSIFGTDTGASSGAAIRIICPITSASCIPMFSLSVPLRLRRQAPSQDQLLLAPDEDAVIGL